VGRTVTTQALGACASKQTNQITKAKKLKMLVGLFRKKAFALCPLFSCSCALAGSFAEVRLVKMSIEQIVHLALILLFSDHSTNLKSDVWTRRTSTNRGDLVNSFHNYQMRLLHRGSFPQET
jgi:hypothetical protein